jgi:hypothetical protein
LPAEFASSIAVGTPTHGALAPIAVTSLDTVERDAITAAILTYHGNLTRVARALHIAKSTLYLKIQKYGLDHILQTVRPSGGGVRVRNRSLDFRIAPVGESVKHSTGLRQLSRRRDCPLREY